MVWSLNRMHNFRVRTDAEIVELYKRQKEHTRSLERINEDLYGDPDGINEHEGELRNLWTAHNENAKRISRLARNFEQLLEYLDLEFHSMPAETKLRAKRVVEFSMPEPDEISIADIFSKLNGFKEWADDDDAS